MMNKYDTIELAVAADGNYFDGMLVTVASVAMNTPKDRTIRFHILDGGISDTDYSFLVQRISEIHKAGFVRHVIDDSVFDGFPPWAGASKMTYARLLLPKLLPDIGHVIYIDCDILWTKDISELWDKRDANIAYQAVHEEWDLILAKEAMWFAANNLRFVACEYFTAGMSFFNLDMFRRLHLDDKTLDFLSAHRDVQWVDQSALNAITWKENLPVRILPADWACTIWLMTPELLRRNPILHFAGTAPWKSLVYNRLLTDVMIEWFKVDSFVRKCSIWSALRRYYSPMRIVTSRVLFLVGTCGEIGKMVVRMLMVMAGKGSAFKDLERLLYRLK